MVGSVKDDQWGDHEGHNRWTIEDARAAVRPALVAHGPHVLLVLIGTNDLIQPAATDESRSAAPNRMADLLEDIYSVVPGATVLVGTLPLNLPVADLYNAALRRVVEAHSITGRHVRLVETGAVSRAHLSDGVHPNDRGYQRVSEAWYHAITELAHGPF